MNSRLIHFFSTFAARRPCRTCYSCWCRNSSASSGRATREANLPYPRGREHVLVNALLTCREARRRPLRPPAIEGAPVRVGHIWPDTAREAPFLPTLPEGQTPCDGLPP